MSGLSGGTGETYRRARYFSLRGSVRWVTVGQQGWGEKILDLIMLCHAVLGLKTSTKTGEMIDVQYFHDVYGCPEFSATRVRYKLLSESLTKNLPSQKGVQYKIDFAKRADAISSLAVKITRSRRGYGQASTWVLFLFRSREIRKYDRMIWKLGLGV